MRVVIGLLVISICAGGAAAQEPASAVLDMTGRWHSRYVSEGRDNLDDGGLLSAAGVVDWRAWKAGGWFGAAVEEDYQELNLFVERGVSLGPVELSGRYTRLDFIADQRDDNELSVAAALSLPAALALGANYTYATEAEGGFLTVSLSAGAHALQGRLGITATLLQGFDYGYASESFDGANHRQAGIEAALGLGGRWRLVASVARSWALADVRRSGGEDQSWVTLGLGTTL